MSAKKGRLTIGPGLLLLLLKALGKVTGISQGRPDHDKKAPWESPIGAMFATDWLCDPNLPKHHEKSAERLKAAGYNAIMSVGDLAVPPLDSHNRHHIKKGRTTDHVEKHVINNIKWISQMGMRPILTMLNEPTVRSGKSSGMGAFGGANISPSQIYTEQQLAREKTIMRQLFDACGESIYGLILVLEPSQSNSVHFQQSLAHFIREDVGFKGPIYGNGFDRGAWWNPGPPYYVRSAPSINSFNQWMSSSSHLKNLDGGAFLNAANSAGLIPQMLSSTGPDGWILYFQDFRGIGGPSTLQGWMIDPVKQFLKAAID